MDHSPCAWILPRYTREGSHAQGVLTALLAHTMMFTQVLDVLTVHTGTGGCSEYMDPSPRHEGRFTCTPAPPSPSVCILQGYHSTTCQDAPVLLVHNLAWLGVVILGVCIHRSTLDLRWLPDQGMAVDGKWVSLSVSNGVDTRGVPTYHECTCIVSIHGCHCMYTGE